MSNDDASATYRGYRRQAIYALFRLFSDSLPDGCVIQPEGTEDLAIFDNAGKLIEIVQVKDHTDKLAASSFKPSFYERVSPYCAPDSSTIVRIATFGPIGPDLQGAISGDQVARSRVLKTITNYLSERHATANLGKAQKRPDVQASEIIAHIDVTPVAEVDLVNTILSTLSNTVTGVSPKQSFEFLMWWLLTASEAKLKISRNKAIAKIQSIGKFLSQRAAYYDEWYSTIVPIVPSDDSTRRVNNFENEFYRGGRVSFDHIELGLDVPRNRFLKDIHDAFKDNSVVVIHSASGQGKTTLSYRYAKDFAASDFRLEVLTSSDLRQARRIAQALIGHAEAVEVPTLIFFDVRPGDILWLDVVRELVSVGGIRVLVSVREEDWKRTRISAADFSFAEVSLSLEQEEAKAIYDRLTKRVANDRHLDFEDAWSQFGVRKTLFEFVYFITQEESLATRISSQIRALQDEVTVGKRSKGEVDLLHLVAVASAYEARLDLAKLVAHCNLPSPQRTIERFDNEYLIRVSVDGANVEGYHSIRSEIIANNLTDKVISPWSNVASQVLPLILEADLSGFLLCAFSRQPEAAKVLVPALTHFQPCTWIGTLSVVTSLMWNGLKLYAEHNSSLLDEIYEQVDSRWHLTLDWELGQALGKDGLKFYESIAEVSARFKGAVEYSQKAKERQSEKCNVFADMQTWLEGCSRLPSAPSNAQDFTAMSEVFFWLGHLKIRSTLQEAISVDIIECARNKLSLYSFGEFIRGIRESANDVYGAWLKANRTDFIHELRKESGVLALDETTDAIVAHFIIDFDRQFSLLSSRGVSPNSAKATIHDLTIERVTLLSNLFSNKKQYGAVGYGHRISLFPHSWDEANKPGVLSQNLHPKWPLLFNALARGRVELKYRPANWELYFQLLQLLRENVLNAFTDLRQSIMPKNLALNVGKFPLAKIESWEQCRKEVGKQLLLPKVSVDEWGYVTETARENNEDPRLERFSGLHRFMPVQKAVAEYSRCISNFMSQAKDSLVLVPLLRNAKSDLERSKIISNALEYDIHVESIKLSVVNGFDACLAIEQLHTATKYVFGSQQMPGADLDFCERERREFTTSMTAWSVFTDADISNQIAENSRKKNKLQWRIAHNEVELDDLLIPTKRRLKNALQSLRKEGIDASVLSERLLWDDKSALWITVDTVHPIASLIAAKTVWHKLVEAFTPDRTKLIRMRAIDLSWQSIILIPLVKGKSLERHAMSRFKCVTYSEPGDYDQNLWQLFPERVPDETWRQIGLDQWELPPKRNTFEQLKEVYSSLVLHVEHMADLYRLSSREDGLDDFGTSILQDYLNVEQARIQPLVQEVYDIWNSLLRDFSSLDEEILENSPNMCMCILVLERLKEAILPTLDFHEQCRLSLEEISNWCQRLTAGLNDLGLAYYLWISDSLGFSAPPEY